MSAFLSTFVAGGLVSLLTVAVEHSRLTLGPLALYGNGALVVPMVGASAVLFAAWTVLLRRRAQLPDLTAAAVGLHLGIGLLAPIDAAVGGRFDAGVLPGFLFQGLIFVVPTALLAAGAAWAFLSGGLPTHPLMAALVVVAGLPLAGAVPPVAAGLGTGVAIAFAVAARHAARVALAAVGLAVFLLFVGLGVPLLYAGG